MSRGWQRAFAPGVLVLLVGMALAAKFLEPDAESPAGSAGSYERDGRRALFLLLQDAGFRVETWRDVPGRLPRLPRGEGVVWLAQAPSSDGPAVEPPKPDAETEPEPRPSPASAGMLAAAHYRRFAEEGGTLLLPDGDRARRFLRRDLGIASEGELVRPRDTPAGPRTFVDANGEALEIDVKKGGVFRPPEAHVLWRTDTGDPAADEVLAAAFPLGRGRVVILADDSFLANARIGDRDHALLGVRLAEELGRGERILFDEYALGLWRARSPVAILASPSFFLACLHLLLLLAVLVLRSAWVREFPRDPPPGSSASALDRARSLASLLVGARRFDLLARFLREGVSRRLERRSPGLSRDLGTGSGAPCRDLADLERLEARISRAERASS